MAHGRSASLPIIQIYRKERMKRASEIDINSELPYRMRTMPEQNNDYQVIVFGAAAVGKSSLVTRFIKGTFKETYDPTIQDTYEKLINCNNNVCKLQITDTTGSHPFPAMVRLSIVKGNAFVLVYSITSKQSLDELMSIYNQIAETKKCFEDIPIILVGNKCDEATRSVSSREGENIARTWKRPFIETSAKDNHNVQELFQKLLDQEKTKTMTLNPNTKQKKSKSKMRKEKLASCCVM